ncbi:hypothetical protein EXU57_13650 [Segetibacter sp. 3557_3]|uniref:BamA/TamA family outer membrane protein n=1 Tax=Segetibacter sp. 3557_3 TaxID=2547429 RepID=UPI0010590C15|nr:BamA/TamA family outer membrane protein [Segetibacter sp. 3557_3]TDH25149.1 hypothetical protein EXU57_13650 [Segetibacter sp. 3557_3]
MQQLFRCFCSMASPLLFYLVASHPAICKAQQTTILEVAKDSSYAIVVAGKQYRKTAFHDFFWGSHYRKEWSTPVKVNAVYLDTLAGGLQPILKGGGRQTRTLRLEDKNGKQYVLRSIDKTFGRALPEIFRGTFSENVINDQVSIAHPYASLAVPFLADAAGIFHTNPRIVFVPAQKGLGEYNDEFKNQLYLFEERPAGNQADAINFGNSEDISGTEKVLDKIFEENDHHVDQKAFIRARLFDMFVSDWGRHEDQWRWAVFKENGNKVYRPIPRDRDQVFTKFDGLFVNMGTRREQLGYLQSFGYRIKDVKRYNFQARHLDRLMANESGKEVWLSVARELKQALTDEIIEKAVKQLPPEIYPISGKVIEAKLKSRRNSLVDFATEYYRLLAKGVDVVGTHQREVFEVAAVNPKELSVKVYDQDSSGNRKAQPYYARRIYSHETKEVRIYGLNGKDKYVVTGNPGDAIKIRLIGGPKKDSFNISTAPQADKIKIYDNHDNGFATAKGAKLYLSTNPDIHAYDYHSFRYDSRWLKPGISYTNEDRLYVGLFYHLQKQKWRKSPFGYQHDLHLNYSITQLGFRALYIGQFTQAVGKWNLGIMLDADEVRDAHFPGVGNNTRIKSDDRNYYRMRTREYYGGLSLDQTFSVNHTVTLTGYYQFVKVLHNKDKFIEVNRPAGFFDADHYAGGKVSYEFLKLDNNLFPSRGISFQSSGEFIQNLKEPEKTVTRVSGEFGFYVPLAHSLTLAVKTGAATLSGTPEFYQLNRLGGGATLRGFLRWRFYGKTAVYNQNELQYNFAVKSFLFNGKMGVVALLDNGRVWQPGDPSDKWHVGYGGGIMLAPFNKISVTGTIAFSKEDQRLNVRLGRLL